MKNIPFPNSQEKICLTQEEIDRFNKLKLKLANSIAPGEAKHYKNELDSLISIGKQRNLINNRKIHKAGMMMATREEKLIMQMKNIEAIVSNNETTAEQKVFLVTQQMSYLNGLVNAIIEPYRQEAGDSMLVNMVNDTFLEFVNPQPL